MLKDDRRKKTQELQARAAIRRLKRKLSGHRHWEGEEFCPYCTFLRGCQEDVTRASLGL